MLFSRREVTTSFLSLFATHPLWKFFDEKPAKSATFIETTQESRKAIKQGLAWLKRTEDQRGGHGVDINHPKDIGCSAMTGLAMLADGSTPSQGPHKLHLRRIVNYLISCVDSMPQGNITSKTGTQLQNKIGAQAHTFFALLFLSQIAGETGVHERVRQSVAKLTKAVVGSQRPNGDWGQESWAPTLGTVVGWMSLRSADFGGFKVGGSPEKTAEHLLDQMRNQLNQRQHWMHNLYKNATGIRVLYAMGKEKEDVSKKAFKEVVDLVKRDNTAFNQAGGEEFLAFHLITETMLQKEGEDWKNWFPMVRDKIIDVQNGDGSWSGHHCITSRTFCTASACLVLSAPNRYLPISQK